LVCLAGLGEVLGLTAGKINLHMGVREQQAKATMGDKAVLTELILEVAVAVAVLGVTVVRQVPLIWLKVVMVVMALLVIFLVHQLLMAVAVAEVVIGMVQIVQQVV
jgi:hypothetical protein